MSAAGDAALVAQCKRELPSRQSAYEELVRRYQNKVYTLCYRLCGDAADAEDLVQEVFTRVFLTLNSFEGRSSFSTWLYRVTYNLCLNHLSGKAGRQRPLPVSDSLPKSAGSSPELALALQQALLRLPKEQRVLLVLKYVMDLEIGEIADILHLGKSAVKMRLFRARADLRAVYLGQ